MCGNLGYTHNPFLVAVPDPQETVIPYVFWNLAHISGGGSGGGYAILSRNTGYAGCIRQKGQKTGSRGCCRIKEGEHGYGIHD